MTTPPRAVGRDGALDIPAPGQQYFGKQSER